MHYAGYLRQRYAAVLSYIGGSLIVVAALFLLPLLVAPFYPAESRWIPAFIGSALPMGLLGFVLWRIPHSRQASHTISVPDGAVVVVLVWLLVIAFGAIPFVATMRLRPHLALFESVSEFTTTGLSVIEPERAPRTLLFFRSLAQLIGGAGFALIVLSSIIPGPAGGGLFAAEGRSSRFVPNIRGSGNIVLRIYLVYTVTGAVALRLAGMGWFDAVNHAFASISTGGFSTRTASIGHWNSAAIEAVVAVLMFLGSFNFMTAYALYRGRFRIVARNGELRFGLALLAVALLVVLAGVGLSVHAHVGEGLRASMFEVVSALTSTGFASTNMLRWPDLGWLVIVGLMLISGGAESTAGGIKQFRIYVLLRSVAWEIRQVFQPRHAVNEPEIWRAEGREYLSPAQVREVGLYVFLYLAVLFVGSGVVVAHGHTLRDSVFEFSSALGTVGLTSGITTPDAPPSLLLTLIAGMLLGRLEALTIVVGLTKLLSDAPALAASRVPPDTGRPARSGRDEMASGDAEQVASLAMGALQRLAPTPVDSAPYDDDNA